MRQIITALIGATALSIACVPSALAADMPVKAPITPAFNWTGFYLGANVGGGWSTRNVDYTANDPASTALFANSGAPPSAPFKSSGALGGVQIGYNWQFAPNWLIGAETDFDWSGMKGSATTSGTTLGTPFSHTIDERTKWFGTVRARLGYLLAPNLLAYATGGFAYGRVEHTGTYISGPTGGFGVGLGGFSVVCNVSSTCFSGSTSSLATGWTVGGGLEYAVWQNWSLKAEYLYVSLASKSLTESAVTIAVGSSPASFNANYSRTNLNVARVGLNYRF